MVRPEGAIQAPKCVADEVRNYPSVDIAEAQFRYWAERLAHDRGAVLMPFPEDHPEGYWVQ